MFWQKQLSQFALRKRCFATLLKSHFGMGVLLCKFPAYFQNTFSEEHLYKERLYDF